MPCPCQCGFEFVSALVFCIFSVDRLDKCFSWSVPKCVFTPCPCQIHQLLIGSKRSFFVYSHSWCLECVYLVWAKVCVCACVRLVSWFSSCLSSRNSYLSIRSHGFVNIVHAKMCFACLCMVVCVFFFLFSRRGISFSSVPGVYILNLLGRLCVFFFRFSGWKTIKIRVPNMSMASFWGQQNRPIHL